MERAADVLDGVGTTVQSDSALLLAVSGADKLFSLGVGALYCFTKGGLPHNKGDVKAWYLRGGIQLALGLCASVLHLTLCCCVLHLTSCCYVLHLVCCI